ncbi:MAG: hypothetical protein KIT84_11480 [Labilithrix sp.]|nr:hypothetical protein [Labilithrix sp.]MCW5811631.1 hypothetical protein [Labilithrix sp.]
MTLALLLPLASMGALPTWARLVGVESPHVCHCSLEHHDCTCSICDPEHSPRLSTESLEGRCGDDDVAFGGSVLRAVLPAPFVIAAAPMVRRDLPAHHVRVSRGADPPPTPPPRVRPV